MDNDLTPPPPNYTSLLFLVYSTYLYADIFNFSHISIVGFLSIRAYRTYNRSRITALCTQLHTFQDIVIGSTYTRSSNFKD